MGFTPGTVKFAPEGRLHEPPPRLQTPSYLDHRQGDQLGPAVAKFRRTIEQPLNDRRGDARAVVKAENVANLDPARRLSYPPAEDSFPSP
jgi:hypothetical protein